MSPYGSRWYLRPESPTPCVITDFWQQMRQAQTVHKVWITMKQMNNPDFSFQAKVGKCNIPKPGFFDFEGQRKWYVASDWMSGFRRKKKRKDLFMLSCRCLNRHLLIILSFWIVVKMALSESEGVTHICYVCEWEPLNMSSCAPACLGVIILF